MTMTEHASVRSSHYNETRALWQEDYVGVHPSWFTTEVGGRCPRCKRPGLTTAVDTASAVKHECVRAGCWYLIVWRPRGTN